MSGQCPPAILHAIDLQVGEAGQEQWCPNGDATKC